MGEFIKEVRTGDEILAKDFNALVNMAERSRKIYGGNGILAFSGPGGITIQNTNKKGRFDQLGTLAQVANFGDESFNAFDVISVSGNPYVNKVVGKDFIDKLRFQESPAVRATEPRNAPFGDLAITIEPISKRGTGRAWIVGGPVICQVFNNSNGFLHGRAEFSEQKVSGVTGNVGQFTLAMSPTGPLRVLAEEEPRANTDRHWVLGIIEPRPENYFIYENAGAQAIKPNHPLVIDGKVNNVLSMVEPGRDAELPSFVFINVGFTVDTGSQGLAMSPVGPFIGVVDVAVSPKDPVGTLDTTDTFVKDSVGFRVLTDLGVNPKTTLREALLVVDIMPPLLKATSTAGGGSVNVKATTSAGGLGAQTLVADGIDDT